MRYLNTSADREFSCVLCGHLEAENFIHMERNINIHVMIIVETGTLNIEIDSEKYKVRPGEMILLPAGIPHRGFTDEDTDAPIKYFWAHFISAAEYTYSESPGDKFVLPIFFTLTNRDRVRILYNQLLDISIMTGFRQKYRDLLFTALCCEISAQFENENVTENKAVNKAIAYINGSIDSKITLRDVAEKIGYSKQYLSRIFKEYTGLSVNEYIVRKKLECAKQILTASDEPISAIALSLGFEDAGYFMRLFKKHEGMTCLKYKNAYSKIYVNKV